MKAWSRGVLGIAVLMACVSCDNPTGFDPHTFYLCVHDVGIPVPIPDQRCGFPIMTVGQGKSVTYTVETINVRGGQRTAQLTLPSGGSGPGVTATLGSSSIAVPGMSSITITVAPSAQLNSSWDFPIEAKVSADDDIRDTMRIIVGG